MKTDNKSPTLPTTGKISPHERRTEIKLIRNGIIISILWITLVMAPLLWPQSINMLWEHLIVLFTGLGGIFLGHLEILRGIRSKRQAEKTLKQQAAFLDGILHSSHHMAIAATDMDFRILYYNSVAETIFGHTADEVIGQTVMDIHFKENVEPSRFERAINIVKNVGEYHYSVIQDKDDGLHYIDSRVSGIHDPNTENELVGFVLMSEDITQRKKAIDLVEHQASFDTLTDLPNRRMLMERLAQSLSHCKRHGQLGAVLFLDLDHFKEINDTLGHLAGDFLLKEVATRLKKSLRKEDTAARLGGDEFVILLSGINDEWNTAVAQIEQAANKILSIIANPYTIQQQRFEITVSIGIALFPKDRKTPEEILNQADNAMYQAKKDGRNTLYIPPIPPHETIESRKTVKQALSLALEQEELQLYIQPHFNLEDDLVGATALPYWKNTTESWVPPAELIEMAGETGLIVNLNRWLVESACLQFYEWVASKLMVTPPFLMVAISPALFRQPDFTEIIRKAVEEAEISPVDLVLELTETVALTDSSNTIEKISDLNSWGIRFSMTNIHSTHTSMNHLQDLPLKMLKVDQSLVQSITTGGEYNSKIDEIASIARYMKIKTIAESVATQEQLSFLKSHSCTDFIGDYFCSPLTSDAFIQYLQEKINPAKLKHWEQPEPPHS